MTEIYPTDAYLSDLSGTCDPEQEVLFVPIGESPYYTSFYKMLWRLLDVSRRAGDLRVYKDGDLTFAVRPGKYFDGDTAVDYAGSTGNALTNNATNYIYLTAAGVLTVNTTGWPAPSATPHLPLATIVTNAGGYSIQDGDLIDYRGRGLFTVCGLAKRQLVLALSGTDNADGTGTMDIQVQDRAGNDIAERFLIRTWIADAEYSAPDAQTDFSVTTGEQIRELTADADYEAIADATGLVTMNIDTAADKTIYVMAEIDGRIFTGSIAITGN